MSSKHDSDDDDGDSNDDNLRNQTKTDKNVLLKEAYAKTSSSKLCMTYGDDFDLICFLPMKNYCC